MCGSTAVANVHGVTRPLLFSVLFWILVPTVLVIHLTGTPMALERPLGLPVLTVLVAALVVLWLKLPWQVEPKRTAVPPAFLAVCLAVAFVDGTGVTAPLLPIAFGIIGQSFGHRTAYGLLALMSVLLFATGWHLHNWIFGLQQAGTIAVLCGFGVQMVVSTQRLTAAQLDLRRREERIRQLAVAEERARMARDMHDSVGHYLTVIKIGLENAERLRTRAHDDAWAEVRQAKELTAQALQDTRRSVRALRPPALDGRMGSAALAELARTFDGAGVRVDLKVTGPERRLGPDAEIVLYRAFQEGLTNVIRHAEATTATAELSFPDERVRLTISDDGKGAQEPLVPGFGLQSLTERVAAAGGQVTTRNSAGGFEIEVVLPR